MAKDLKLYSLFYLDRHSADMPNLQKSDIDAWKVYVNCGITLAKSCAFHGVDFCILTNDAEAVSGHCRSSGYDVNVEQIAFGRELPPGTRFYPAHFKLDVLSRFAQGSLGDLVGLVDLDVVMINPLTGLQIGEQDLVVYDISERFPEDQRQSDLNLVRGADASRNHWFGGELIIGRPTGFAPLVAEIEKVWPTYLQNLGSLHHVGDEAVVSAALNAMPEARVHGSPPDLIYRWWSCRSGFKQAALASVLGYSFLHLPADKDVLSSYAQASFSPDDFIATYTRERALRMTLRQLSNPLLNMIRRERKYSPVLK